MEHPPRDAVADRAVVEARRAELRDRDETMAAGRDAGEDLVQRGCCN
jgi:hypothetical protein